MAVSQTQEAPGLDLRTPPARGEAATPAAPQQPGRTAGDGKAQENTPIAPGEGDVALSDRVKAVQRKGFLKRGRLELGVFAPATINDAFYEKLGVGGKLAYNFEDSFALALRGAYWWQVRTDHVREGKAAFSSQLLNSQLQGQAMLDGVWSPIYGKIAWLGSSIVHFDVYLLAGLGAVWSATSSAGSPHAAADLGAGMRFYPASWFALDAGVVGTFYTDQPTPSAPSTVQKVIAAQLGFTVFFPLSFEYVYP